MPECASFRVIRTSCLMGHTSFDQLSKIMAEEFQVVAFNQTNDLEEPPDYKYVYRLPTSFPGTIVSIDFTLDEEYLNKVLGKKND